MPHFSLNSSIIRGAFLVVSLAAGIGYAQDRVSGSRPTATSGTTVTFDHNQTREQVHFFTIVGEVAEPGVYRADRPSIEATELVAGAGGLTPGASPLLRIVRNQRSVTQAWLPSEGSANRERVSAGEIVVVTKAAKTPSAPPIGTLNQAEGVIPSPNRTVPVCCIGLAERPVVLPLSPEIQTVDELCRRLLQNATFAQAARVLDPQGKPGTRELVSGSVVYFDQSLLNRETLSQTQAFPGVLELKAPKEAFPTEATKDLSSPGQMFPEVAIPDLPTERPLPTTSVAVPTPTPAPVIPRMLPNTRDPGPLEGASASLESAAASTAAPRTPDLPIGATIEVAPRLTPPVTPYPSPGVASKAVGTDPVGTPGAIAPQGITGESESAETSSGEPSLFRRSSSAVKEPAESGVESPRPLSSLFASDRNGSNAEASLSEILTASPVSQDQIQALKDDVHSERAVTRAADEESSVQAGSLWSWPLILGVLLGPLAVIGTGLAIASVQRQSSVSGNSANPFDIPPAASHAEMATLASPETPIGQLIHRSLPIVEEPARIQSAWPLHGRVVGHRRIMIHEAHEAVPRPHFVQESAPPSESRIRGTRETVNERKLRQDLRAAIGAGVNRESSGQWLDSQRSVETQVPKPVPRSAESTFPQADDALLRDDFVSQVSTDEFDIITPPSPSPAPASSPLDRALRTLAMENRQ